MLKPLVSIIIPVYNGSDYLKEAIDSALAQTYDNIEVIVINDGSTDGGATEKIAKSYGSLIQYFYKTNGGVSSALNFGINISKGDYISWLSHDDVLLPSKIQNQIDFFNKHNNNIIIYGEADYIDEKGRKIGELRLPDIDPRHFFNNLVAGRIFTHPWKSYVFVANGCTMLFPKEAFQTIGRFNEGRKVTQDYEMWILMNQKYDFILSHEPYILSRKHEKAGSIVMGDQMKSEVASLMDFALSQYRPGDEKFDLEVGKTLLAWRLIPAKQKAYNELLRMFWVSKKNTKDVLYVLISLLAGNKIVRRIGKRMGI